MLLHLGRSSARGPLGSAANDAIAVEMKIREIKIGLVSFPFQKRSVNEGVAKTFEVQNHKVLFSKQKVIRLLKIG